MRLVSVQHRGKIITKYFNLSQKFHRTYAGIHEIAIKSITLQRLKTVLYTKKYIKAYNTEYGNAYEFAVIAVLTSITN